MASGHGALASHRAAARLGRLPGGEEELELSVPKGRRVRLFGVVAHQAGRLDPVDVSIVDAIPVTAPTRTLIDLASVVSVEVLEEALDDALRRGLTSVSRLQWRIDALGRRGRPGISALSDFVEARTRSGAKPESVLETRFLRLIRQAKLPEPVTQHEIRDKGKVLARVDFAYPYKLLAIEVDGHRWHSGRTRWEHDLRRRNALTSLGWRVVHVTSSDLKRRPDYVTALVAGALGEL
jgi:very-short-patch-repair endonuclease